MKLRVAQLVIHTVLVADDGEELHPGPQVDPVTLAPSQVADFIDSLPEQLEQLQAALTA